MSQSIAEEGDIFCNFAVRKNFHMSKGLLRNSIFAALIFASAGQAMAITADEIRFKDIDKDTTIINMTLSQVQGRNIKAGDLIDKIAMKFVGTPYVGGTLEGDPEKLTVDMTEFDCTTFVESVAALAMAAREGRSSWRDFSQHLRTIRYRGGTVNGYSSRLHYISDWIVENTHGGRITEVTALVGNPVFKIKTLDFMTRNKTKYPALADSANLADMKRIEMGYRSHRYPQLRARDVSSIKFENGDIVFFTTKLDGLDVTHAGIIHMVDGKPHLLHASSKSKRVVLEKGTLAEYLKRNATADGIRVVRLTE